MRQESIKKVEVRGAVIGGPVPLVCLPMVATTKDGILAEAKELVAKNPDLLEWRVDAYEQVEDVDICLGCLQELREIIQDIPLIFTCRIDMEGGMKEISQARRLEIYKAVMASGNVDIVDIELCNEPSFVESIRAAATSSKVKLILSHHNFKETPSKAFIYAKLHEAQLAGADIAKLAAMPQNYGDVLRLMSATNTARNELVEVPIVTMSMGPEGAVSRLAGGLFGSDITFALGTQASAPGQIPIKELRVGMDLLY